MAQGSAYRERLIATGFIVPKIQRPAPPLLKLDAAGRQAAARHIEEYWAAPWEFNTRPFYQEAPEWLQ